MGKFTKKIKKLFKKIRKNILKRNHNKKMKKLYAIKEPEPPRINNSYSIEPLPSNSPLLTSPPRPPSIRI